MVITQDAVYILTVPSAMDRQVGVLPTSDAPLVKDLMLRLSMASEASDKSLATRSDFFAFHIMCSHSHSKQHNLEKQSLSLGQPNATLLGPLSACTSIVPDASTQKFRKLLV